MKSNKTGENVLLLCGWVCGEVDGGVRQKVGKKYGKIMQKNDYGML